MTSFVITGNSITAQTLASGENGFVGAIGSLYTETATAVTILAGANTTSLTVLGAVGTASGVAAVRTSGTAAEVNIVVGTQGSITSGNTDAIRLATDSVIGLRNAGLISGDGIGVFAQGLAIGVQTARILNSGTIMAQADALSFGSDLERVEVNNSGTISGNDAIVLSTFVDLSNSGSIIGNVSCRFGDIRNDGTITGSIFFTGSTSLGYDFLLSNTGTIHGGVTGGGRANITNSGTITGLLDLFFGLSSNVVNSGLIESGVDLSSGNDTFTNLGGNVVGEILGRNGNDFFTIDRGDLRINGGDGTDTVASTASYRMGTGIEILELRGATGLTGIGRDGNETIVGGDGNDTLLGRAGNDSLGGAGGDDLVRGNAGNDTLSLTDGTDTLDGGTGVDTLILGSGLRYTVNLATGTATGLDAAGETDRSATLSRIENVSGADLNDAITGSAGNNLLQGNSGFDTLGGGNGNDTLSGGDGADSLTGGSGADVLIGGAGADTMTGGTQADTFQFFAVSDSATGAADRITDFSVPDDTIDLAGVDADPVAGGDQVFVFVGTAAFAGLGAQVRYAQDAGAGTTTVQVRLAGDAITDMEIVLTGLHTLTAADFVL